MLKIGQVIVATLNDSEENIIKDERYIIEEITFDYVIASKRKFTLNYESFLLADEIDAVKAQRKAEHDEHINTIHNWNKLSKKEKRAFLKYEA